MNLSIRVFGDYLYKKWTVPFVAFGLLAGGILHAQLGSSVAAEAGDAITSGLALQWKANDGSGLTAGDSTSSNDGILTGMDGVTAWSGDVPYAGKGNSHSLVFNSADSNDYVTSSENVAAGTTGASERTVCSWVKLSSTAGTQVPFSYGSQADGQKFGIYADSGNWHFFGHSMSDFTTSATTDTGWHNHCVAYDGVTVTYYYDGVDVGSAARTLDTTQTVFVAGQRDPGDLTSPLDGRLDDIRLYDRALSLGEIREIANYAAPGGVFGGLNLWLKADDGVSGTGTVTSWSDQTGYNTFNTVTGDPQTGDGRINFNNTIDFDGDDYIDGDTTTEKTEAYVVSEINSGTVLGQSTGGDDRYFFFHSGTELHIDDGLGGVFATIAASGTPHIFSGGLNGASSFIRVDSNDQALSAGVPSSVTGEPRIGARENSGDEAPLTGSIAEVITLASASSGDERQRIESYLGLKYGITLDAASDYLDSSGVVIYGSSASHSGYTTDISGLGQDSLSALDQRVSQSVNDPDSLIFATTQDFTSANLDGGRSSLGDGNFFLVGHNGSAKDSFTSEFDGGTDNRSDRVWSVGETGTVNSVYIGVPLGQIANMPSGGAPAVAVSNDTIFDSADTVINLEYDFTNELYFAEIDPANGDYLSFVVSDILVAQPSYYRTSTGGDGGTTTDGVTIYPGFADFIAGTNGVYTSFVQNWSFGDNFFTDGAYTYRSNNVIDAILRYPSLDDLAANKNGIVFPLSQTWNTTDEFFTSGDEFFRTDSSVTGAPSLTTYPSFADMVAHTNGVISGMFATEFAFPDQFFHDGQSFMRTSIGIGTHVSVERYSSLADLESNSFYDSQPFGPWSSNDDIFVLGITAGFTQTQTELTVDEDAGTNTFDVVLDAQPLTDVVFDISSDNINEATASPATLTFTSENWDVAQTVTVTGVDDTFITTNATTITTSIDGASSDDAFDPLADQSIAVTLVNDDGVTAPGGVNGGSGTVTDPFTNMSMAYSVESAGVYYFDVEGHQFSTRVNPADGGGWILVASGDGSTPAGSPYPQVTALDLQTDDILSSAIVSNSLTGTNEIKMEATGGTGAPMAVYSADAGPISRLLAYTSLGYDVGHGSVWTGDTEHIDSISCDGTSLDLDSKIWHTCGDGTDLHWIPSPAGHEYLTGVSDVDFNLWVRTANTGSPLKLWLKADAGVAGEAAVTAWTDQSNNGHTLSPGVAGTEPSGASRKMNYNASVEFDGNDMLQIAALNLNTDATSVFAVTRQDILQTNSILVAGKVASSNLSTYRYDASGESTYAETDIGSGLTAVSSVTQVPTSQGKLVSWLQQPGAVEIRLDGHQDNTGSLSKAIDEGTVTIGARDDGSEALDGDIAEIIVYEQITDSGTELRQIESYLALKYGLTLEQTASQDYILSDGTTTVWDAAINAEYDNDIAGVARDDASGLNQLKSKSENSDGAVTITVASLDDKAALVWGNDNDDDGAVEENGTILDRIWRVDETGETGNTSVEIDLSGVTHRGTDVADFALLIDDDSSVGDAPIQEVSAASYVDDVATFENVNFSDGDYFTFRTVSGFDITGVVYYDEDGEADKDAGEATRLQSVAITLYDDNDSSGTVNTGDTVADGPTDSVAITGDFVFSDVGDGSYVIQIDHTDSALNDNASNGSRTYGATTPKELAVNMAEADIADQDFGFDEAEVSLDRSNVSINEDGTPPSSTTITATILPTTGFGTTVSLLTGGGATDGVDYEDAADNSGVNAKDITIDPDTSSGALTVNVLQDSAIEGTESFTIDIDSVTNAIEDGSQQVSIDIFDDDSADFTLTESAGATTVNENGGLDTFEVALSAQPLTDVVLSVDSSNTNEATVNMGTLTFTSGNWNNPQTVTVTGVDDNIDRDDIADIIVSVVDDSSDDSFDALGDKSVNVVLTDDDTAGVTITEASGTNIAEGGGTDSYTVILDSEPTGDVVMTVSPDSEINIGGGAGTSTSLTFTTSNWNNAQTVTVTAEDDAIAEGPHTSTITHTIDVLATADPNYDTLSGIASVTANITDNDSPGVLLVETDGSTQTTEGGPTDSYTVALTTQPAPATSVTLDISTDAQTDLGGGAGTPIQLVFDDSTWNDTQEVTVAAVDDTLPEGPHTSTISTVVNTATTTDPLYDAVIGITNITNSITDNDQADISISANAANASENPAVGGQFTVTSDIANNSPSSFVVSYSITGSASQGNDYDILSGSVNIPNGGGTAATIDITTTSHDDATVEGDETVIITLNSVDTPLAVIGSPVSATVTIADDETDSDNDSIDDALESATCVLYPSLPSCPDPGPLDDSDGDGIPDVIEVVYGLDPVDTNDPVVSGGNDMDNDAVTDAVELAICTAYPSLASCPDPSHTDDSDSDGIPDIAEYVSGTDPTDPDSPVGSGENDDDGDGLTDAQEHLICILYPSTPDCPDVNPVADTDGDGVPDAAEILTGLDPTDVDSPTPSGGEDSDGDGYTDAQEEFTCVLYPSLPSCPDPGPLDDSDGDGIPDVIEAINGFDPTDRDDPLDSGGNDSDGDGVTDAIESALCVLYPSLPSCPDPGPLDDSDGDGIPDVIEFGKGSDPTGDFTDSDGDGITDAEELLAPNHGDGNGDGISDHTQQEVGSRLNPTTSEYVTIAITDNCMIIDGFQTISEASLPIQDRANDYPVGLIDFQLTCNDPGDSATVNVFYEQIYDTHNWRLHKYDEPSGEFISIASLADYSTAVVGDNEVTTIRYIVTDGSSVTDQDGLENALIDDPAGPAVLADTSPSLLPETGQAAVITIIAGTVVTISASLLAVRRHDSYRYSIRNKNRH